MCASAWRSNSWRSWAARRPSSHPSSAGRWSTGNRPSRNPAPMSTDTTLFEKLWERHEVADLGEGFSLLHVDRHLVPDFNGNAFTRLAQRGLKVRNPELTFATADHSVSTDPGL